MKHIHAELMALYAQDAMESETPWEMWQYYDTNTNDWIDFDTHPMWFSDSQYRRKPKTININGFQVPEPIRNELKYGDIYYVCRDIDRDPLSSVWYDDQTDKKWLKLGVIHLTHKAALLHQKALLSFANGTRGDS
jgi:hypothetical protein